jgi:hypothetical protein
LSRCELPSLELDRALAGDRPQAFDAPWQAQAFAMALLLHDKGVFTWAEWAAASHRSRSTASMPPLARPLPTTSRSSARSQQV